MTTPAVVLLSLVAVIATSAGVAAAEPLLSVTPNVGLHSGDSIDVTVVGEPLPTGTSSIFIVECANAYADGTPAPMVGDRNEYCSGPFVPGPTASLPGSGGTVAFTIEQTGIGYGNRACIASPPATQPCYIEALASGNTQPVPNTVDLSFAQDPVSNQQTTVINAISASEPVSLGNAVGVQVHVGTANQSLFGFSPDGIVTVTEGTDTLASKPLGECCPVRAPATAKLTVPNLGLGEHILVAHYAGNGSFAPIDSPPLTVDFIDANNVSIGDVALWIGPKGIRHTAFKVVLSKPAPVPVTVTYQITDGTAVNGTDFLALNGGVGTVTIPKAGLAATISVPILAHTLDASSKTFTVTLTSATGGYSLGKATGVGTLLKPVLTSWFGVADVTVPEGDRGTTHNVLIPITRADASTAASITLTVVPETATSGSKANGNDFVGGKVTRTLTFDVGVVQRTLTIPINRDTRPEGDEFFTVSLGHSSISPDQLTGHVTILGE